MCVCCCDAKTPHEHVCMYLRMHVCPSAQIGPRMNISYVSKFIIRKQVYMCSLESGDNDCPLT
jgi:hypothetical protein